MKTKVNWVEKLHLKGETETGHVVIMDSTPLGENSLGPSPKELILQGSSRMYNDGCSLDIAKTKKKS